MSTRRRSLGAASRAFTDHLNRTLASTVTQAPLTFTIEGNQANIRFRGAVGQTSIRVRARQGSIRLYLGQICMLESDNDGEQVLRTMQHRYALIPDRGSEAQIRWEYVRVPGEDNFYCRYHIQGPIPLNLFESPPNNVELNDLHVPTGWVPVEGVLRFCIVDLGVRPLNPDWHQILLESERRSRAVFASMDDD